MKTSLLLILLSCSALGLSARAAGTATRYGEMPVSSVAARIKANGDQVTVGTDRIMVAIRLGSPNAVTADGSWLYRNYVMRHGERDAGRPATLVVRFHAGQVSRLTVADDATVVALREMPRQPTQPRLLASAPQQ
ncbi:MAG TPA: hypothetical protein VG734_01085 [Lacunisphaera sp.]|nr:hypothetical protein [Lacunisphaera sp.]